MSVTTQRPEAETLPRLGDDSLITAARKKWYEQEAKRSKSVHGKRTLDRIGFDTWLALFQNKAVSFREIAQKFGVKTEQVVSI
jgi:hypothetical protein